MEFLDISSLRDVYQYAIKIKKKLKQKNKREFGSANPSYYKHGKGVPNLQNKGWSKDKQFQDN